MTNTQNSSFAATVLNALSTARRYDTGLLIATETDAVIPNGYADSIGPLVDIVVHFHPGTISGITLAYHLDRALAVHQLGHTTHIDWDMDVIVYTREWENYSISNWTDDPSMIELPNRVKFSGVQKRRYAVLTTFLDSVATLIVKGEEQPKKPVAPKHRKDQGVAQAEESATVYNEHYGELPIIKRSDVTGGY